MEFNSYLIVIFTALFGLLSYIFLKRNSKYPPGPTGIPYFGSFFSVGTALHLTFCKWTKKYGPVFSVKIGGVRAVVLNDTKSIREAFKEDAFAGRPANKFFMEFAAGGKDGVAFADGNTWIEQRRFALRGLRDFGFGKKSMEALIMTEVDEFMEWLHGETEHPISFNRKFSLAILNSIWMIISGKRFRHDDPELRKLSDANAESVNQSMQSGFLVFFPDLIKIAPEWTGWNKYAKMMRAFDDLMQATINEHEKTFVQNTNRDFVDMFLANIKSTTDPSSSFYKKEGYRQLKAVLLDFFGAGSETTSATLTWAVLYLTMNPKVQKKMQEELDRVVGLNRKPTLDDKSKMPYMEAVMMEVLRMSSIVPSGLFHNTMSNVKFQNYEIPKDTYIIANLYGVHHDPNVWGDPETFRPERFLKEDGITILKPDSLLPFSIGKRNCIGENFAKDEFFLFLSNIFHTFEVTQGQPTHEISLEPKLGFILQPKPFSVILKNRILNS